VNLLKFGTRGSGPAEKAMSEVVLRDHATWLAPRAVDQLVCLPTEPEGVSVLQSAQGQIKRLNVHFKLPYEVLDDLPVSPVVDAYFEGIRKLLVMAGNHPAVVDGAMSIIWHTYNNLGSSLPAIVVMVGPQNSGKSTFLRAALLPCGITNLANEWAAAAVSDRIGMAGEVRKESFTGADKGTAIQTKPVQIIEELNNVPQAKDTVHALTTGANWLRLMYAEAFSPFYGIQVFASARVIPWQLEHSTTNTLLNRREYFLRLPGLGDVLNGTVFDLDTLAGAFGFEAGTFKDYGEFNNQFLAAMQAALITNPMFAYSWFKRNYGEVVINPKTLPGCYEPRHAEFYGIEVSGVSNPVEKLHGLPVITSHIAVVLGIIGSAKGPDKLRLPQYVWDASHWYYTYSLPKVFCHSVEDENPSHPFGHLFSVPNNHCVFHESYLKIKDAFLAKNPKGRALRLAYDLAVLIAMNTHIERKKLPSEWEYLLVLVDALLGVKDCFELFRQTPYYKDRKADYSEGDFDIPVETPFSVFFMPFADALSDPGIRKQLEELGIENPRAVGDKLDG
jgi:hypothetical protein